RDVLPALIRPVASYGIDNVAADFPAFDIHQQGQQTRFKVRRPDRDPVLDVTLNLPGRHNVQNALAAIAIAHELDVDDAAVQRALTGFEGVGRRFQSYGEISLPQGQVLLVDDYGHHPREVAAALQAARQGWPERRLVAVFQPHRYTRTRDLLDDFASVLSSVDALVLTEVYAAGETPIPGADGRALARAIRTRGAVEPVFVEQLETLPDALRRVLQDGDLLITLGAGSIGAMAAQLPDTLRVK